jgi:hypothetical protein
MRYATHAWLPCRVRSLASLRRLIEAPHPATFLTNKQEKEVVIPLSPNFHQRMILAKAATIYDVADRDVDGDPVLITKQDGTDMLDAIAIIEELGLDCKTDNLEVILLPYHPRMQHR